jgi:CheY-like chemotaxis protein
MKLKILVVEDEEDIAAVLRDRLESFGAAVTIAGTGHAALREMASATFDGVFMDVRMPELDGISTLTAIRDGGDTVPVIICTAFADRALATAALAKGADDYLVKPFVLSDLKDKLEQIYNKRL